MNPRPLPLLSLCLAIGCSDKGATTARDGWLAERDTVGDTVVVRTVSGSVWEVPSRLVTRVSIGVAEGDENLMLADLQGLAVAPDGSIYLTENTPTLKRFGPDGAFIEVIGRMGSGPGEYRRPDGGLAVLPDGRVVIRDPGNGRLSVYTADGDPLTTWRMRTGFSTSRKIYVDSAGSLYTLVLVDPQASVFDWVMGLQRYRGDGTAADTLIAPRWNYQRAQISGSREGNQSINDVPFAAEAHWTWSPLGYFVGGVSNAYRITLFRSGAPLRIERQAPPVPVQADEAADHRRVATDNMVRNFPGWVWNGPDIPATKPPFRAVYAGDDGRIWVLVSRPGAKDSAATPSVGSGDQAYSVATWKEPVAFDVFEADGRYLGQVAAPKGFQNYPEPTFRGDTVWAAVEDADGVRYVQRLEIVRDSIER
jgi:hypothetical protein